MGSRRIGGFVNSYSKADILRFCEWEGLFNIVLIIGKGMLIYEYRTRIFDF